MTLRTAAGTARWTAEFAPDRGGPITIGRGREADVRIGHERIQGRWTVSKSHALVHWDGRRWVTANVSDKPGLFQVYEPGYEETPLEPGREWAPMRHRWSYSFGAVAHPFHVVCETDDHRDLEAPPAARLGSSADDDDEPTAGLNTLVALQFTELERATLKAYYRTFGLVPRPTVLEPASHDAAAAQLDRSRDSLRKAIERANEKIGSVLGAPPVATGRNVSPEIGRWLARIGLLDP